ncbi:MAG: response regulator [Myxococcota bacterium]|nr:response regulator [Myxococcota bacterium]
MSIEHPIAFVISGEKARQRSVCGVLEALGCEVRCFDDALSAMAQVERESRLSLIVSDMLLDGLDGRRLVRMLRASQVEKVSEIPIILMSSLVSGDPARQIYDRLSTDAVIGLPLDARELEETARALLADLPAGHPPVALVVDEIKALATIIGSALRQRGFEAILASDAEKGLQELGSRAPDVVVWDTNCRLPDEKELPDALWRAAGHAAIVLTTSKPTPKEAAAFLVRGVELYQPKPFDPHVLADLCLAIRRERALNRAARLLEQQREHERQMEERLAGIQKLEAIGRLAGGVAHDFNNLLSGILGHTSILKLDVNEDTQAFEAVLTIESAALRAAELTRQLLGFAQAGKNRETPCDLHQIIQEVTNLLGRTIGKEIRIELELPGRSPLVKGDPNQLQQVVLNLAVNARDAMPQGGVLSISVVRAELSEGQAKAIGELSGGPHALLVVSDSGAGMPQAVLRRVFEPFFTTKEQGKGTGLGLSMVYGIIRNHGGAIAVTSEVGQGTKFEIYLPLVGEAESDGRPRRVRTEPARGSGTILVVDDEPVVRKSASRLLRRLGYEVLTASGSDEALQLYARRDPIIDLVLLDLNMPGMDGHQCFLELQRLDPQINAVLSTGYGLDGKAEAAIQEGMVGFLPKPYSMIELAEVVRTALTRPSRPDSSE